MQELREDAEQVRSSGLPASPTTGVFATPCYALLTHIEAPISADMAARPSLEGG